MADIKTRFAIEGEQQFKSAMTNAANAIKVLNSEQRLAKAQFENTGNAEKYAATQADILRQKIEAQKNAVKAAEQAIKQLSENGVDKSSKQFQQWQTKLNNAQTTLTQMETDLQKVTASMQETGDAAENTGDELASIGQKVSFDAVISGIGKITDKMEAAARKAKELAGELVNAMRDSAAWADDLATTATVYGFSTDEVQRMQYTAKILDTTFETIVKSRQKMVNAMQSDSNVFSELGVRLREYKDLGGSGPELALRNWEDVFWDLGEALTNIEEKKGFEYVNKQAQQLLGRNWEQLKPIFNSDWASENNYLGKAFNSAREYYDAVMASWDTVSDEDVGKLTKLDDAMKKLESDFKTTKETILAQLAPAFTEVGNTISGLLEKFNEYLQTEEGQQKLSDLSEAVSNLFTGLTDVDFGTALETAKGAIDGLTKGLKWIADNWTGVKIGLAGLAGGFAALKVSETVLTFMQLLASGKFLFGSGAGSSAAAAAAAGTTAGSAWGASFAAAATAAAPWLFAILASKMIPEENKLFSEKRVESATYTDDELSRLREWVDLQNQLYNVQKEFEETGNQDADRIEAINKALENLNLEQLQQGDLWNKFWDYLVSNNIVPQNDKIPTDVLDNMAVETPVEPQVDDKASEQISEDIGTVETPVDPQVEDGAAEKISAAIGTVEVPVKLVTSTGETSKPNRLTRLGTLPGEHANGLWSVPWDGYPEILHKGERVVPAREVNNTKNFNSNLYIESMNMNNGQDAEGLAAAIVAAQRRTMSGYGS